MADAPHFRTVWQPVRSWSEHRAPAEAAPPSVRRPHPAPCVRMRAAPCVEDPAQGLLRRVSEKLEVGHWRVACRRYCMLLACAYEVPGDLRARCDQLLQRCSVRERASMLADAARWAQQSGRTGR